MNEPARPLLLDFSACHLEMTASEFMQVIDDWFSTLGIDTPAALMFCGEAQKDQAMLFDTKNFLVGGRTKSFLDEGEARSWLESWTAP